MITGERSTAPQKKSEFYYGYVIVAATFVIMVMAFGVTYSFGVFFNPLLKEFGWSRAVTSGAYSIVLFVSGIGGICGDTGICGGQEERYSEDTEDSFYALAMCTVGE